MRGAREIIVLFVVLPLHVVKLKLDNAKPCPSLRMEADSIFANVYIAACVCDRTLALGLAARILSSHADRNMEADAKLVATFQPHSQRPQVF